LSADQVSDNPDEVTRINATHPNEESVISDGRVLGNLQPTRVFGDAEYKYPREVSLELREKYYARNPSSRLLTPPYVTAEPEITSTQIKPTKGDFVVMASDSLWECLSNEEVVGPVGLWLQKNRANGRPKQIESTGGSSWSAQELSVTPTALETSRKANLLRVRQWQIDRKDDRFVVEDDNIATHLVRNALGGRNEDLMSSLIAMPPPNNRRFRYIMTQSTPVSNID
jgi:pyruvate dehydrogenase phosphatase